MLALNIFFLNFVLVLGEGTPCTLPNSSSDSFRVIAASDGGVSLHHVSEVEELTGNQVSHSEAAISECPCQDFFS